MVAGTWHLVRRWGSSAHSRGRKSWRSTSLGPPGGVGEEDADLTVFDLTQSAAPLASDPTALGSLLGERAGIEDQDGVVLPRDPADMASQLPQDRVVIPSAGADEELDVLVFDAGAGGDRFGGLALQAADEATNDQSGVRALLLAIEAREITTEEPPQALAAATNGLGCERRIIEKGLGVGMIEESHRGVSSASPRSTLVRGRRGNSARKTVIARIPERP